MIDVIQGSKLVVARGPTGDDYQQAYLSGLAAANVGLDLFCAEHPVRPFIDRPDRGHVAWWADAATGRHHVAVAIKVIGELSGSAHGEVSGPDGRARPRMTVAPAPTWHESFRYFRVSQTTNDLHDSYRNLFLALESLLDHIAPQKSEGERAWFERAMRVADSRVGLAAELCPREADPIVALCDELYRTRRTAVAHSKSSRGYTLPFDQESRAGMTESVVRLGEFYVALVETVLGIRRRRSGLGLAPELVERMNTAALDQEIFVSDDDTPLDDDNMGVSPAGRSASSLRPTIQDGPVWSWSTVARDLAPHLTVRRVVGRLGGGKPGFVYVLEADLELGLDDVLEVRVESETSVRSLVRRHFSS